MKKYLIIVLLLLCLAMIGCKKEEKEFNIMTCIASDNERELKITIYQNPKTYEFVKIEMEDTVPKSVIDEMGYDVDEFTSKACDDLINKNCAYRVEGDKYIGTYEYDAAEFTKNVLEDKDYKIDKIDKDTLTTIQRAERLNEGMYCTIS